MCVSACDKERVRLRGQDVHSNADTLLSPRCPLGQGLPSRWLMGSSGKPECLSGRPCTGHVPVSLKGLSKMGLATDPALGSAQKLGVFRC